VNKAFTIWCTGLPQAGGSKLASALADYLQQRTIPVKLLLSTSLRASSTRETLGFTKEDRDQNVARLGNFAHQAMQEGTIAVVAAVSPFADARNAVRQKVGAFFEVHISTPKPACIDRCTTGNWAKALTGEVRDFTGVDQPYEAPTHPECDVDLSSVSIPDATAKVVQTLERAGYLSASADADTR
jgi:adenylylsulfate kinase